MLLRSAKDRVRGWVDKISDRATQRFAHNIELGLQSRALGETCDYVEAHLAMCVALSSTTEILDFAVGQIPQQGFVCEFGVFQGRSINHLAARIKPRTIHGFDSFEGLPEDWRSGTGKGAFRTSVPPVAANVVLHKGWFDATLPGFAQSVAGQEAALLHVDCDLYSSTKTVFDVLGSTITTGSVLVFDEYFNYPGWKEHEHKALQEFCASSGKRYQYLAYNKLHEQVVVKFL